MGGDSKQAHDIIFRLRWIIPPLIACLGVIYLVFDHVVVEGHPISSALILREALVIGLIGPVLAWFILTWAAREASQRESAEAELAHRNQELSTLNEISATVSQSLDLNEVLDRALDKVLAIAGAEAGEIRVLEHDQLVLKAHRRLSPWFLQAEGRVGLGECLCGMAAQCGKVMHVDDTVAGALTRPACQIEGFRSVVSAPVRAKERVVGVIHIASYQPHAFTPQQKQLLAAIGNQIGLAIENAQLYAEVKDLNQQLDRWVQRRTEELMAAKEELSEKARQLRQLVIETMHIEEKERARIAHEMHDGVIQLITGTLYETQAAKETLLTRPQVAFEKLRTAQELLKRMDAETRRAIYDLRPLILDSMGLVPALREHAASFSQLNGVPCALYLSGTCVRLPADTEVAVYRIVQEALNNVATHAQATSVQLFVDFTPGTVRVVVQDDGRGFDVDALPASPRRHLGLIGMRERAESVGGKLEIRSRPGEGTRVILEVPAERTQRNLGELRELKELRELRELKGL